MKRPRTEREFLHEIASPLAGLKLTLEGLMEEARLSRIPAEELIPGIRLSITAAEKLEALIGWRRVELRLSEEEGP